MALHALAPALTGHVLVQAIGVRDDGWDANSRKGARGHETSAPEDRGTCMHSHRQRTGHTGLRVQGYPQRVIRENRGSLDAQTQRTRFPILNRKLTRQSPTHDWLC